MYPAFIMYCFIEIEKVRVINLTQAGLKAMERLLIS